MEAAAEGRTHESMWDSILYVALVGAGRMLVANASDHAAPPKGVGSSCSCHGGGTSLSA
jgi:hypothetical protein